MNNSFVKPVCEIVHFDRSDIIVTSGCCCDVEGVDFGPASNETGCVGKNLPECTCGLDNPVNCVD